MATESVLGLFQTPDQYQLAQQAAQMEQARQYAAQDPMQRAVASQYFAGGQLGRALGGEDPQLKMISARQQILKGVNPQDMKSIEEAAIQFSRLGDGAGVQAMQELAFKQSQITKNLREGNAAMLTTEQRNFAQAQKDGYTGTFNQWLTEQKKAGATNVTMPEIKLPSDVNAIISSYEKAVEGDVNVKNLASTAKGLINQAATSNNPSAWEAARTQVAKAVGEGKLSNEDIARTGIDPTLIGGVRDWLGKKVVGVPDQKTQQALYVVASYLEKTAGGRISEKRNSRIAAAKAINPAIDTNMMFPDYSGSPTAVTTPTPSGKIVDFKDFGKKAQ